MLSCKIHALFDYLRVFWPRSSANTNQLTTKQYCKYEMEICIQFECNQHKQHYKIIKKLNTRDMWYMFCMCISLLLSHMCIYLFFTLYVCVKTWWCKQTPTWRYQSAVFLFSVLFVQVLECWEAQLIFN